MNLTQKNRAWVWTFGTQKMKVHEVTNKFSVVFRLRVQVRHNTKEHEINNYIQYTIYIIILFKYTY